MSDGTRKGLLWISAPLAAAMLCTMMPVTAQATDVENWEPQFEITGQGPMRARSQQAQLDADLLLEQSDEPQQSRSQDAAYYDLNVELGEGVIGVALVQLQQDAVYTQAKQSLRKWREDAYNDSRVKFRNSSGNYVTVQQWLREKNMSKETYLSPKWDNTLERIAIQRALESTYTLNHLRTGNDSNIWTATVDGKSSYGEVLAFQWNTNFSAAFDLWMGEKSNYIRHTNGESVTENDYGHYMSIIDPGSANMSFAMINGVAAGEINGGNGDTTPLKLRGSYMLPMGVSDDVARTAQFDGLPSHFAVGKTTPVTLWASRDAWNPQGAYYAPIDPFIMGEWTSENTNAITANGYELTAVGPGTAHVVFDSGTGRSWSGDLTVYRFTDVSASTPHEADINWLSDSGITKGYANSDGTTRFEGMTRVYRQDMAAFLRREAVKRGIGDAKTWKPSAADWNTFRDVNRGTPHAEDILWLAHAGISTGWKEKDGSSTFRGMSPVVRQDMAAFLRRLAKLGGKDGGVTPKYDFRDVKFTDPGKTPHADDIAWLAGSGISEGWKVGNAREFRGMSPVVRQDMAAFLHRLDNQLAK
ncbi:internalin [Bifidobacterium anseris]|uniref:Internalin n=1 Tax=Bifidobacterium anseris TaxID=2020963 RepID=A0A2N5J013_9BIFI|nr:S-layer homology domain-containing protein [Bifidobacterium anseris]PLS27544.1 internalin [Bifidobacterium anseris]